MTNSKLQELIARAKARQETKKAEQEQASNAARVKITQINGKLLSSTSSSAATSSIEYNTEQQQFIDLATKGNHAVLIGAAGTGKTTTMKGTILSILQNTYVGALADEHKYLSIGTPGIIATSYTRRSVANLKRAMPSDMQSNCITLHKLLEYQPVYYSVIDQETGNTINKMEFKPNRGPFRPLDENIKVIIIDEASTVSVELFKILLAALAHPVQFIFLGDIQQLPPVFGSAILGYKGVELANTTIELKQVYRQALESPIIKLAHRILSGKPIPVEEYAEWKYADQLTIHPWKKRIHADAALLTVAAFFKKAYDTKNYDPDLDMILIPFNKSCGTDELNKHIANHLAKTANREVFEIIAGFNKHYYSIGDTVMYEKEDALIVNIAINGTYTGKYPQPQSKVLDYWGHRSDHKEVQHTETLEELEERIELAMSMSGEDIEAKTNQASHVITLQRKGDSEEIVLDTSAEINALSLGYAMTVHKSQGSEWRKVFCVFHQSHATMIQRELLYTAVTRAREELYVICEPDTFTKGILNQRIKGETLAEKFEWFKGKMERDGEENGMFATTNTNGDSK